MSGIATAVVASAVIGGVVAKNSSDKAASAVKQSANSASAITRKAANQARAESKQLFGGAQQNANLGFQGALDVFGQSLPSQVDAFQQGNVGAQQQILAGLPQIQNAILGGNVDLSALQPTNIQTDLGFFNQQLPEFVNPLQQAQQQQAQQQAQQQQAVQQQQFAQPQQQFAQQNQQFAMSNPFQLITRSKGGSDKFNRFMSI